MFVAQRTSASANDIYALTFGEAPVRLTTAALPPAFTGSPVYAPNGTVIYYTAGIGGTDGVSDVWRMNADGSGQTQLTVNAQPLGRIDISPDGQRIVYASGTANRIVVRNVVTNALQFVGTIEDNSPVFWPTGFALLFNRSASGGSDLYYFDLRNSALTRLFTTPDTAERSAVVSPLTWSDLTVITEVP